MSRKFSAYLRQHFEAKMAGRTPPPRLAKPLATGPHRLGDSGYSFVMRQSPEIPGLVDVMWVPDIPPASVVHAHLAEYQAIVTPMMLSAAKNGGLESWA